MQPFDTLSKADAEKHTDSYLSFMADGQQVLKKSCVLPPLPRFDDLAGAALFAPGVGTHPPARGQGKASTALLYDVAELKF